MSNAKALRPIPATLIPGDGIGPEITEAVVGVLDALGAPFEWDRQPGGMAAIEEGGRSAAAVTARQHPPDQAGAQGPADDAGRRRLPLRERPPEGGVRPLRQPAPGASTMVPGGRYEDIDIVLVRENLEGLYVGFEHYIAVGDDPQAVAISSGVNTRAGARRIVRFAFDYALRHGRKKVTVVHKANVLKALTGLFLEAGREIAREYEGRVQMDERIVDACAMQLVLNPWQFDVIVTTNLFGDILSDQIAGLIGGLGMAPGANIGETAAIFEAVHGSAPDIAGKGVANPLALLLAAALMLDHVALADRATRLRAAVLADAPGQRADARPGRHGLDQGFRRRPSLHRLATMDRNHLGQVSQREVATLHHSKRKVAYHDQGFGSPGCGARERGRRPHLRHSRRREPRRRRVAAHVVDRAGPDAARAGGRLHGGHAWPADRAAGRLHLDARARARSTSRPAPPTRISARCR